VASPELPSELPPATSAAPRRLILLLPLLLFLALGGFLLRGLQLDPRAMPSALIDQPLPEFSLPILGQAGTVDRNGVIGEVALVNVWATWCGSCRVEHPYLTQLAAEGVPIYGINYKDVDAEAVRWLQQLGDPYRLSIVDAEGSLGLDLGVYGAPETYVVDAAGYIRYRHVGVVNEQTWQQVLQPIMQELQGEG
jgi:cytochrome c biogenesis protein CcmG/thiol:disulfide interchange protein DsbE